MEVGKKSVPGGWATVEETSFSKSSSCSWQNVIRWASMAALSWITYTKRAQKLTKTKQYGLLITRRSYEYCSLKWNQHLPVGTDVCVFAYMYNCAQPWYKEWHITFLWPFLSSFRHIGQVLFIREVGCWCGCLSGARCRLAYGPADATSTHRLLASVKSRLVLPFWYRLTWVVRKKGH